MKFFKLQIIAFVLFYSISYGMQRPENCCADIKKALKTHLLQEKYDDDWPQKQQRWLYLCLFGGNNDVENEENLLDHNDNGQRQQALEIENHINARLAELERHCLESIPDTPVNINNNANGHCLFCQYLYPKEVLAYVVHSSLQNTHFHYSFCFRDLCDYPHLYGENKCYTCRGDIAEVKMCTYLQHAYGEGFLANVNQPQENQDPNPAIYLEENQPPVMRRIINYDGALLSQLVSFWSMFLLSCYITNANKKLGDALSNGEFQISFTFDAEMLFRDIYGYQAGLTTYFLHQTRTSATILMDKRGLSYLLLPIITLALTANGHLNIASWVSMGSLFVYIFDLYTANLRKTFIVSPKFGNFGARFPQLNYMGMNQEHMENTSVLQHVRDQMWYNFQYWNLMGSLAAFVNWKITQDTYNDIGEFFTNEDMSDVAIYATTSINIMMALYTMVRSHKDAYNENKEVFTWNQLGQFLLSTFMVRHSSPVLLTSFLVLNMMHSIFVIIRFFYRHHKNE